MQIKIKDAYSDILNSFIAQSVYSQKLPTSSYIL